jgi:radical SAM protein with 4Fe4S-binding SPASM domain
MMHSLLRHLGSILWKRRPIQLTFFVTRKCNARCPFCFYLAAATPPPAGAELALDEIERLARPLGTLLWLAFSGGEIFLRQDLIEISRIFYRHNRPAILLLPTNGMLPELIRDRTEQIVRECPKSTVVVKLSLDGVGGAHDALRRTPGGFEKLMHTYRLLTPLLARYPNFELGINTVFMADNQDRMDEIADFVAGLPPAPAHTVSLVRGALADASHKQVDLDKYERIGARLARALRTDAAPLYRFAGASLKAAQDVLQRRLILRTARAHKRLIPCYAGRLNLVLSETGEIYPCETRRESFGNVREHGYDLRQLLRTQAALRIRRSIRRRECACTHECYFITNILFNPRLYPALAREYLAALSARRRARAAATGEHPAPRPQPEQALGAAIGGAHVAEAAQRE